jgi:hypothetical protein
MDLKVNPSPSVVCVTHCVVDADPILLQLNRTSFESAVAAMSALLLERSLRWHASALGAIAYPFSSTV